MIKDYLDNKPIIQTRNLILREYTINDVSDLKEWLGDAEIYTYWGRNANNSEINPESLFIDPRPHIKRKPSKDFKWGMVLKENNKLIGEIQVFDIENDRMAKVAYRLSKKYWGKGLTSEALHSVVMFCFENTELQRLSAGVDVNNIASWKVMEKCGFLREGLIRQGKMLSTYCDYYLYGMLKNDYRSKQAFSPAL